MSAGGIVLAARPRKRRLRRILLIAALISVAALLVFTAFAHPFLAITQRAPGANVLIVEGWIYDYMMQPAAEEFARGGYTWLATSGLELPGTATAPGGPLDSFAAQATRRLIAAGVPPDRIITLPTPHRRFGRTSAMARAVREGLAARGIEVHAANVVTAGAHARESWIAYRHVFGADTPMGVVSIPKRAYPADLWWTTTQGWIWVTKDFVGWLKQALLDVFS